MSVCFCEPACGAISVRIGTCMLGYRMMLWGCFFCVFACFAVLIRSAEAASHLQDCSHCVMRLNKYLNICTYICDGMKSVKSYAHQKADVRRLHTTGISIKIYILRTNGTPSASAVVTWSAIDVRHRVSLSLSSLHSGQAAVANTYN